MKEEEKFNYEDVIKMANNDCNNSMSMFPLIALLILSGNKESELKAIEKQLDEIKWLLTDKK